MLVEDGRRRRENRTAEKEEVGEVTVEKEDETFNPRNKQFFVESRNYAFYFPLISISISQSLNLRLTPLGFREAKFYCLFSLRFFIAAFSRVVLKNEC